MNSPRIIKETEDYAVIFKPPKMHSVPLPKKEGGTLLEWYAENSPPVIDLMHRLDYETHGLILAAKTQKSFEHFSSLQEKGEFVKEYSAVCESSGEDVRLKEVSSEKPFVIESWFRPYGPGRKLVRPVIEDGKKHKEIAKDRGGFYRTEIIGKKGDVLTLRIRRGFRHQIRCHLSWKGLPIKNDILYGGQKEQSDEQGYLALCAHALFFSDPSSGEKREYRIESL